MDSRPRPIAPLWHAAVLILLLAVLGWLSIFLRMGSDHERIANAASYVIVIAYEWTLLAFCLWRTDAEFVGYVARVMKNVLRQATGTGEHPANAAWWREALGRSGFQRVEIETLAHEGGIATADAPASIADVQRPHARRPLTSVNR